jgi:hypothetical protein
MDRINRWKLADELTAYQIALLIAGYDPSEFETDYYEKWPVEVKVEISAYLNAIKNAALSDKFEFKRIMTSHPDYDEISWNVSTINIDSFTQWLQSRNFVDGFFIKAKGEVENLSNKIGEFYAPKLAAAVRAWNEVTSDSEALNGKTPKKALEVWLRKHASEYCLTNKDGNPNELGIEEICKVANWKPTGGASPTPSLTTKSPEGQTTWSRKVRPKSPTRSAEPPTPRAQPAATPIDDDIPF